MMPPCGTFDYVAVVPDDPDAFAAGWPVALRRPVARRGDRLTDARLVGHAPRLRITDAGMTPDAPRPPSAPFARPRVLRSQITLTAGGRPDAQVRAASFHVAQGLIAALRPRDVLHLARTAVEGLGLSVLRGGRLIAAVGDVEAVPLGNVDVSVPRDVIAEIEAVLKRRHPSFTYGDLFRELPLDVSVDGLRHVGYRGRCELGEYDLYVVRGPSLNAPMCVALSLKGACPAVAANASAQLLALDDLAMVEW